MLIPYKDENPTTSTSVVTIGLIVVNIVIFLLSMIIAAPSGYGKIVYHFGLIPGELISSHIFSGPQALPPALTIFTSMFFHGGFLHLGGNMLYLWIFGNNIEDYLGHLKFFLFYVLSGLVATFGHLLVNSTSQLPMVGASGAIAGVLGAYLLLYPRARVRVFALLFIFITTIRVPAIIVLGFWIILQVINGMGSLGNITGGTAWFAHIGGFLAGILLIRILPKRKGYLRRLSFTR